MRQEYPRRGWSALSSSMAGEAPQATPTSLQARLRAALPAIHAALRHAIERAYRLKP